MWFLEVCWGWFRTYHRLERVHFPFTMYSRHKALFIGLRRRWCFFEKRNSISVDLSRYWSKFHTLHRSIRRFNFPPLGRLNSWLFPLNPPPPLPPGAKIMFKCQTQVHFLKKEKWRPWLSTHLPGFKTLDLVDLYFWVICSRKWGL